MCSLKRCMDLGLTLPVVILLSPLYLLLIIAVKLDSAGPVFFRQTRTGKHGKPFQILKFRSMVVNAEKLGRQITASGDPRITRMGSFLRKTKLDELPQLINVLRGEMSLVGPRPEVPRYTNLYTPEQARVLDYVPGITDPATIEYRHEEEILAQATDQDRAYLEQIMPEKLRINLEYQQRATLWTDLLIIFRTFSSIFTRYPDASAETNPSTSNPPR